MSRGHDIPVRLTTPLSLWDVESLHAGDRVILSGTVYTARDAAHARLVALLAEASPSPSRSRPGDLLRRADAG